uniref:Ionotropic glutamate receptor C-terminal domain-containing protein n=1 Tax=Pseudo-nitzschia australis TaxID=44445 RepID=A0A7S4AT62_9STRA
MPDCNRNPNPNPLDVDVDVVGTIQRRRCYWSNRKRSKSSTTSTTSNFRARLSLLLLLLLWTLAVANGNDAPEPLPLGKKYLATVSDGGAFSDSDTSFRQAFCDRYTEMDSSQGEITVGNALSGAHLNVALKPDKYFRYNDTDGINSEYPGIHARILDRIAEQGNFTWRDSFGIFTYEQKGPNRSITELLTWGVDKYDLMLGTFTPSVERINQGVSFVNGHFDGSLVLVRDVEPPVRKIDWFNFLKPFDWVVWGWVLGVVIFSAFAYQLIESIGGKGARYRDEPITGRVWLMDNLYLSFINLTGNYSYEPTTLGGRVFGFFFAFWAMLITAAYTANLASLLVVKAAPDLRVASIEDAISRRLRICVHSTSYSDNLLREKYPDITPLLVPVPIYEDMYTSVRKGEEIDNNTCDVMVAYKQDFEVSKMRQETNPKCSLEWEGRQVKILTDGFVTKLDPGVGCTDLVNEVIGFYMHKMKDDGELEELWLEHNNFYSTEGHCKSGGASDGNRRLTATTTHGHRSLKGGGKGGAAAMGGASGGEDKDSNALTIKDMAGTLLFQIIGSAIAIAVAVVSRFDPNTKKKVLQRSASARNIGLAGGNRDITTEESEEEAFYDVNEATVQGHLHELTQQMDALSTMIQGIQDKLENNDAAARNETSKNWVQPFFAAKTEATVKDTASIN